MRGYRRTVVAKPIRTAFHSTLQVQVDVLFEGGGEAECRYTYRGIQKTTTFKTCDLR